MVGCMSNIQIDIPETSSFSGTVDGHAFCMKVFDVSRMLEQIGSPENDPDYYKKAAVELVKLEKHGMKSCSSEQAHIICSHVWEIQKTNNELLKKNIAAIAELLIGTDSTQATGLPAENEHGSTISKPATPNGSYDSEVANPMATDDSSDCEI